MSTGAATDQDLLALGIQHHQAGRLPQAEHHYREILEAEPEHPGALHLLGVVAHQVGAHDVAIDLIGQSVALQPDFAEAHSNLGNALRELGRLDDAVAAFQRAVAIKPDFAAALGNLGNTLRQLGRGDDAVVVHRKAVALEPLSADGHNNLGNALRDQRDLEGAATAFGRAIELRPRFATAHSNLGNVLKDLYRAEEAAAAYRKALELKPDTAEFHNNLGSALNDLGRFEEAIVHHDRALELRSDYPEAHLNKALPLLSLGRLAEGWREYESRLQMASARRPPVAAPAWDGGPLEGKTILVCAEQGIGDEILFASCLPDLVASGGHYVIECEPRLAPLFARSFPAAKVLGARRGDTSWIDKAPAVDLHIKLGSLMRRFRPNLESFPDHHGYLVADPAGRDRFAERLAALGRGLKVGISWRSMLGSRWNASYAPLEDWRDLLALPGVRFVNLQYDRAGPEIAEAKRRLGIGIHEFPELDLLDDLDGVAALIAALDLVIAPTNTVSNLAGALGKPAWFLDLGPSWSMFGTDYHPWFPGAHVFRRTLDTADWDAVLARVCGDLATLIAERDDQPARVGARGS